MTCDVCAGDRGVADMTDGKKSYLICDECRDMVTTFFHVYANLAQAVQQVRLAKTGRQ